jgi:hypothetical protein
MSRLVATLLFFLLLALPAVSSAPEDLSELDRAAEILAMKLASPIPHIVEVADFTSPNGAPSKQGEYVLLSFVPALQFHGKGSLLVKDHSEFVKLLAGEKIKPPELSSQVVLKRLAGLTGVDLLVVGTIARTSTDYTFHISAIHVPDGGVLDTESGPLSDVDFLDSLGKPFPPQLDQPIYQVGVNGVSFPVCKYMPDPQYNDFARRLHIQGKVVIEAVLSPEGRVVATHPLKLLGFGLDEESAKTLKQWRCEPARRPDGTPVYARTFVEMTFQLGFSKR